MHLSQINNHDIREILDCLTKSARAADPTFPPATRLAGDEHLLPVFRHRRLPSFIHRRLFRLFHIPGVSQTGHTSIRMMTVAGWAYPSLTGLFGDAGVWGMVYLHPTANSALFGIHREPLAVDPRKELRAFVDLLGCRIHVYGGERGASCCCLIWPPCQPATVVAVATRADAEFNI